MKFAFVQSFIVFSAVFAFATSFPQKKDFELLLLHNNDMHSRFEETSRRSSACKDVDKEENQCYGGFARTAHVIRNARKAALDGTGPDAIYLNAGDTYTGTEWFSVHKGKIVAEFLNILRPDAASLGNHEFDMKVAGILPFLQDATFPIVAANLDFSKEPLLKTSSISKSTVLDVSGQKIGVIGYLTPDTAQISAPEGVIFKDEVKSIKEESEKLHKSGIKIIIAVGHSGIQTDIKIAKEVPLVDIVIGGHSNTFLWNGKQPDLEKIYGAYPLEVTQKSGKKVYVAQAYAYTKYMGMLHVTFNQAGEVTSCVGQPKLLDHKVPQEKDVLEVLDKYRVEVEKLKVEIVGKTRVVLDGTTESCRFKECNFGSLISDAFVEYHASKYVGKYWTDAPIAILNGGSIRNSIEPRNAYDNVTRGDLIAAMPFDNPLTALTLQGTDLLKTLEIGIRSNGETSRGELLQVSGLHVVYDLALPVGSRVVSAKARCGACRVPVYEPVDPLQSYRLIVTGFMLVGGDGLTILKEKGRDFFTLDLNDWDAVAWYITKHSPIYTEESERFTILNSSPFLEQSGGYAIQPKVKFLLLGLIFTKLAVF